MAAKRKRRHGAGRHIDDEQMAAALAMSATRGVKEACEAFNISERTFHRRRAQIEADPTSDLAVAVNKAKLESLERVSDLLTSTWEAILNRIKQLLPQSEARDVVEFAKVIGEHKLAFGALGLKDEPSGNQQGTASAEAEGAEQGTQAGNITTLRPVVSR